jgi:hypothetical protein
MQLSRYDIIAKRVLQNLMTWCILRYELQVI